MPRWKITFIGRKNGAIGTFYKITAEREGATADKAVDALCDEYERLHVEKVQLVS